MQRQSQIVRTALLLAVATGGLGLLARATRAGTILDSVADSGYTTLANQLDFASVAAVQIHTDGGPLSASGVLIDQRWLLTAAHVTDPVYNNGVHYTLTNGSVSFGTASSFDSPSSIAVSEFIAHSSFNVNALGFGYDIGLIRLATPVTTVSPATLYVGTSETGSTATIVGYGLTGTGILGEQTGTYGIKRAGNNVLDVLGSAASNSDYYTMADFDQSGNAAKSSFGSSTPLTLEYSSAAGDSGGGVFILDGGVQKLAGVVSFGENGPIGHRDTAADASYGDLMAFSRVGLAPVQDWIADQTSARYWANASGGSYTTTTNWDDATPAAAANIAVFNLPGNYTVSGFGATTTIKRARVVDGNVTWDLGSSTLTLTDATNDASLVVSKYTRHDAQLTIINGTVNGVSATIGQTYATYGQLTLSNAVLNLTGDLYVGGMSTGSGGAGTLTLQNGASLNIGGTLRVWASGIIPQNVVILNGNDSYIGALDLSGGTITGSGNLTVSGNSIWSGGAMSGSGTLTNSPSGSFTLTGSSNKSIAGALNNQGTLSVLAGALTVSGAFNNSGSVNVSTGWIALYGGGTHDGSFVIASGAALAFYGGIHTLTGAGTITGQGALEFKGGTMNIPAAALGSTGPVTLTNSILTIIGDNAFTDFAWSYSGTLTGEGTTTIPIGGTMNFTCYADFCYLTDRTIENRGTLNDTHAKNNWVLTDAIIQNAGVFNIGISGTTYATTIASNGSNNHFVNSGVLNKVGTNTAKISVPLDNIGTINILAGTLDLNGGGTRTGSFNIASGATLTIGYVTNTFGVDATITGLGTLNLGDGTVYVPAAVLASTGPVMLTWGTLSIAGDNSFNNFTWTNGNLMGSGTTTIPTGGTMIVSSNGYVNRSLDGRGLCNLGILNDIRTSGSPWYLTNATISNFGTFNVGGNNTAATLISSNGGTNLIINSGVLNKVGTNSASISVPFENSGTVNVAAGTLAVSGSFNNSGMVNVLAGGLSLNGVGTHSGNFAIASGAALTFGGGTHTLTGAASITGQGALEFKGGTMNIPAAALGSTGPVTLTNSILTIIGDNAFTDFAWSYSGTLTGEGTTTIPIGGTMNFTCYADFCYLTDRTIENRGTLNDTHAKNNWVLTDAIIQNAGVFNIGISGTTYATTIASNGSNNHFVNSGVLNKVGTNSASISVPFDNSGTVNILAGALTFGGAFNNSGSVNVSAGGLSLNGGGTHSGSFAIVSGAALTFGGGTHTFTNAATITGQGSLNFTGAMVNIPAATLATSSTVTLSGGMLVIAGDNAWANFTWNNTGTLTGAGTTTIAAGGTMNIYSYKSNCYLTGRTIENRGTLNENNWYEWFLTNATINNYGTYNLNAITGNGIWLSSGGGTNLVGNAGTINKTGALSAYVYIPLNNTGTVNVLTGMLSISSVTQISGTTLTGGTWIVGNSGNLSLPGSNLTTIAAGAGVTLDGAGSVFAKINSLTTIQGNFTLSNGRNFTTAGSLTNSGTLTVNAGSVLTNTGLYTQTATGSLAGTGSVANNGTMSFNRADAITITNPISGPGTLTQAGPGTTTLTNYAGTGPLNLNAGQLAFAQTSTPNSKTVITSSLTLAGTTDAWTATADLGNNALVVQAPTTGGGSAAQSQARTIANQIAAGLDLANPEGLLFTGTGITSATAANYLLTTGNPLYAIGWLQNNTLGLIVGDGTSNTTAADGAEPLYPDYGSFAGDNPSIGLNDVLVKYTYWGDADLNGIIDDTDVALLVNGYQLGLSGWVNGDFDYNGIVDDTDVALLINAYQFQQGPLTGNFTVLHSNGTPTPPTTPIPEPASLLLLGLGSLLLLRQPRRHASRITHCSSRV